MPTKAFKKGILASLSAMSIVTNSNAENNLSLKGIAAAIVASGIGGALLKEPAKDLYKGLTYPVIKKYTWDKYKKELEKYDFYKFETVTLMKEQKGACWCWLACFEALLSSLGINKTQEELYSMTHFSLPKQTSEDLKLVPMLPEKPAFFEGNRDNNKIVDSDLLVSGLFNGDAFNYLAKRIDQNLYGCKFTISVDYSRYVKPEGMEFIIRHVSGMIGGGWFAVVDPNSLPLHMVICKLQGDTMYVEDPRGPLAYSLDIKTWCKFASRLQELTVTSREAAMLPGIGFEIYAFTKSPISSRILFNVDNSGNFTCHCF